MSPDPPAPVGEGLARVRDLASRQEGLVTRRQCLAADVGLEALRWQVTSGRWAAVYEGVFLTQPGHRTWSCRATAALLWALSGADIADAALSGRSAAYLWGLQTREPANLELVVPEQRRVAAPPGVNVRRLSRFPAAVHDRAFPWRTTVAATVLDVATLGSPIDALSVVARAVQKELVTATRLRQEMTARGGHRYSRLLLPALADVEDGAESGAELLYVRDVERAHGLPVAIRQAPSDVGPRRWHDHEYGAQRLVVEVDGRLGHEQWVDRVKDGRRDRQLLTTSTVTTRVFYADVALQPCETARELAAILTARGWTGHARRCRRRGCAVS